MPTLMMEYFIYTSYSLIIDMKRWLLARLQSWNNAGVDEAINIILLKLSICNAIIVKTLEQIWNEALVKLDGQ